MKILNVMLAFCNAFWNIFQSVINTEAKAAIVQLEVMPALADVIGVQFRQPNSDVTYTVTEAIDIGVYRARCDTTGDVGGRYIGNVLPVETLDSLETAKITAVLIPGTESEDTEHLRERYLQNVRVKPFSGNRSAYVELISGMAGVGAVKVTPFWRGAGTVLITITDTAASGASVSYAKGAKVTLTNATLYASATESSGKTISGTYYIYDGRVVNGRMRVTNSAANVGKTPVGKYVTGWVKRSDMK